jgi:steroid delta-isomerase-like uncharacterized protein
MSATHVEIFRAAHQAYNRRDFDAILNVITEDCIYQDQARGVTYCGREDFRDFLQGWATSSSDGQVSEPSYIDAGDVVVAEFHARGINDGPLGPLPATGRRMDVPMCEIMRFNDQGQIVSGGLYYDQLSMLTQLGHTPAPGAAASA